MSYLHETASVFADQSGAPRSSGNMHATHNEVYSYAEMIAFRDDGKVYITKKKWSVTTSKHTGAVRMNVKQAGYTLNEEVVEDRFGQEWEIWEP